MPLSRSRVLVLVLPLLLAGVPAGGQGLVDRAESVPLAPSSPTGPAWTVTLGALGAVAPEYDGSDQYKFIGVPLVDIRYRDLLFLNSREGLGANLIRSGGFTAGPFLRYRSGRDQDDSDALRGMGDVGGTVEGGGFVQYRFQAFNIRLDVAQGLNGGGHKGLSGSLSAGYATPLSETVLLTAGPSLSFASDNYMQSYFGVTPDQAGRTRYRAYSPGAGVKDVGFGGTLVWRFSPGFALTALAEVKQLLGDAADSPLVDKAGSATQGFAGLGLSWRFGL